MTELFVSYDLALKAKAHGFDKECFAEYQEWDNTSFISVYQDWSPEDTNYPTLCSAPTHQQLVDWLMETYNIVISIDKDSYKSFMYRISNLLVAGEGEAFDIIGRKEYNFDSYYTALNTALLKAFELIKTV